MLGEADDWVLTVELLHTESEAHAVSDSRGDICNIEIFSDNSD